jgi:hypothetical protein
MCSKLIIILVIMIDSVDLRIHGTNTEKINSILNDYIHNGRQIGGYRHSDIKIEHATHSTPFSLRY